MPADPEERLVGGNVRQVVRVGDTVRRPAGPWTPAVHALLTHLHDEGSPPLPGRWASMTRAGKSSPSYPARRSRPDRFDTFDLPQRLGRVAHLIRRYHDAVEGFRPPADARWNALIRRTATTSSPITTSHPGTSFSVQTTPLRSSTGTPLRPAPGFGTWPMPPTASSHSRPTRTTSVRRPDDGCGGSSTPTALTSSSAGISSVSLGRRARSMHDFLQTQSASGAEPWTTLWRQGHGTAWFDDADWIEDRQDQWRTALLD